MPDSKSSSRHRGARIFSLIVLLSSLALVFINVLAGRDEGRASEEALRDGYQAGTERAAELIGQRIERVQVAARDLAESISDGSLAPADYEQALEKMLRQSPAFYGGAIAFAPYALDPKRRLYAPYFSRKNGELEFMYIEDAYDYTDQSQEWFVQAMALGSRWSQPYFDEAVGDILMTTYSAVVYREGQSGVRQPIAVVTIDVAIESIAAEAAAFDLGGAGYAEVVSDQGLYLYSPEYSRVLERQSLFSDQRWTRDDGYADLRELLHSGGSGVVELYDPVLKEAKLVSVAPVDGAGWRIIGSFSSKDLVPLTAELRHFRMFIILGVVLVLCTALLRWQLVAPVNAVISWPTALLVSVVLLFGISRIWHVAMTFPSADDRQQFPIISEHAVAAQTNHYQQLARDHLAGQPQLVPTGIYVESLKFVSGSDIEVVGSVWQKLGPGADSEVQPGVIFPGAARVRMGEPFESLEGGTRLVRWQFTGEWRFRHHYKRYPLVKDVFSIGIFPINTAGNVMLLPDLASYSYRAPSALPGLGPDVFLLGWLVQGSYFELLPWRHNTSFGRSDTLKTEPLPELVYSVLMEKAFLHSIISSLTPLIIALLISFITLLISTSDKTKLEFLRTGVGFDIGISTSIFFVVVLSHIGLRERIVSEEIFYLEYFYMLMYANLIWKCCHSILSGLHSPVLEKLTFGVSAKKVFFPVNLLLIFGFTWFAFYS
tara:strand:+ start:228359 stop:230500 length:2142 start_codon:yes stop_codon:yes gene_type:complete